MGQRTLTQMRAQEAVTGDLGDTGKMLSPREHMNRLKKEHEHTPLLWRKNHSPGKGGDLPHRGPSGGKQ